MTAAFRKAKTASTEAGATFIIPRASMDEPLRVVTLSGTPAAHEGNANWHVWAIGNFDQGISKGHVESNPQGVLSQAIPIDERDYPGVKLTISRMATLVSGYKQWNEDIGKDLSKDEQSRYRSHCALDYSRMRDNFYLREED